MPKKPEQTEIVRVRMTKQERKIMESNATKEFKTLSALVRDRCCRKQRK